MTIAICSQLSLGTASMTSSFRGFAQAVMCFVLGEKDHKRRDESFQNSFLKINSDEGYI